MSNDLVVPSVEALTTLFRCEGHEVEYEYTYQLMDTAFVCGNAYTEISTCWKCIKCYALFKITEYRKNGVFVKDSDLYVWSTSKHRYIRWIGNEISCRDYLVKDIIE